MVKIYSSSPIIQVLIQFLQHQEILMLILGLIIMLSQYRDHFQLDLISHFKIKKHEKYI